MIIKYLRKRLGKINASSISVLWTNIVGKPTFFSGNYNDLSNKPSIPAAQIQSDWNQSNTGIVDFVKNKPTFKRVEKYSGTTSGSGNYTVVYSPTFSVTPDVKFSMINPSTNHFARITASSNTGFTIHAYQRASINLLGTDVLLSATINLNGATISVLVTEI